MPRPNRARSLLAEEHLARRVAQERNARGWSYDRLAKRMTEAGCAIQASALFKIEQSQPRRRITVDELVAFAKVFDIDVRDLLVPPEVAASQALGARLADLSSMRKQFVAALQDALTMRRRYAEALEDLVEAIDTPDLPLAEPAAHWVRAFVHSEVEEMSKRQQLEDDLGSLERITVDRLSHVLERTTGGDRG